MAKLATKAAPGVQLDGHDLMERAQRATGLKDFGDPWFMEPLNALIHFVNTEAGLPSQDVPPVRHVVDMLCDRLRLAAYLKEHPQVFKEKVDLAGFIPGQARGGSTLAQRLFAQSPQLTSTYFWEMFAPIPLPGETLGDPKGRRKIGDDEVAEWSKHMPEYKGMHPLNSNYYEEDIWLTDRCFNSYTYTLHFNIPSYHEWMLAQDHTKVFDELKVWLQVLQYQAPNRKGKKWLLKNVSHLMTGNLELMFKTFPGVKCIQTHRPMDESIPSLASVQSVHIRTSGTDSFDKREMGPRLIEQYLHGFDQMMALHRRLPAGSFIDIRYRDLVAEPIVQFRKVIEGMGLVCGAQDIDAASSWMSKNGRGTHPPHNYAPEDFGVTAAQLRETFKFYHDTFLH
jgi:hypothetical protein